VWLGDQSANPEVLAFTMLASDRHCKDVYRPGLAVGTL
jgi:hypothetical protein